MLQQPVSLVEVDQADVEYETDVAAGTMRTAVLSPVAPGKLIVIHGVENPYSGYTW